MNSHMRSSWITPARLAVAAAAAATLAIPLAAGAAPPGQEPASQSYGAPSAGSIWPGPAPSGSTNPTDPTVPACPPSGQPSADPTPSAGTGSPQPSPSPSETNNETGDSGSDANHSDDKKDRDNDKDDRKQGDKKGGGDHPDKPSELSGGSEDTDKSTAPPNASDGPGATQPPAPGGATCPPPPCGVSGGQQPTQPGQPGDTATAAGALGWGQPRRASEFNGTSLDPGWKAYDGVGHADKGIRSPKQIKVGNGLVTITGTPDGTTGGMAWQPGALHGRWETKARFPAGDKAYHPVLILWPDAEDFPVGGEVDYAEVMNADRQELNFFLHYDKENKQEHQATKVDTTQWHQYAVEWTPDHVIGYVDGKEFFRSTDKKTLPPRAMHPTIQLDWFPDDGSVTKDNTMEVDWIREYAPSNTAGAPSTSDPASQDSPGNGKSSDSTSDQDTNSSLTTPSPEPSAPATTLPCPAHAPTTSEKPAKTQPGQGGAGPTNRIGRIALSSDGNQHDDDDWASSAMALALLGKGKLQRNVVNYIYNNHIWDSAAEHRKNMTESVMRGGQRFGFDTSLFYDGADPAKLSAGVKDLTADINASRPGDELTIVLAGPMETTWMALNAANPEARKHVKCVSHGKNSWNETHGRDDHGGHTYDDMIKLGCQRVKIPGQNGELGPTNMSAWAYLNDLGPDMTWLHSRIGLPKKSKGDVSDAGMVYYVITGKQTPTRADLKSYLQK